VQVERRSGVAAASSARGTVIVIDVLRAFTTAPFALAAGATEVELVATPEEALARRAADPERLLVGEVHGRPVPGFDHGNSPAALRALDLTGRGVTLRSTSGVQAVLGALGTADTVLAASLVTAAATVRRALEIGTDVTLIACGAPGEPGPEDEACADLLEARLLGRAIELDALREAVRTSPAGRRALDPRIDWISPGDLEAALEIDRHAFALEARQKAGGVRLEPWSSG
jgi:2-phosphosulfolactate phosphatase